MDGFINLHKSGGKFMNCLNRESLQIIVFCQQLQRGFLITPPPRKRVSKLSKLGILVDGMDLNHFLTSHENIFENNHILTSSYSTSSRSMKLVNLSKCF